MINVQLNNYNIPREHLIRLPQSDEKIAFNNTTLIASKMDVVLDNTNPEYYDDRYPGSFFYGAGWYNRPAVIFDDDLEIWRGRIKNIRVDSKARTVTVETANIVQDMTKVPCIIESTGDKTPAEIIKEILTDKNGLGLSEADIIVGSFMYVSAVQRNANVLMRCVYDDSDNQNVLSVIAEICRITQMEIFSEYNRINLYQWEPYSGQKGVKIYSHNLIPASYNHEFDDKSIYNSYSIAYKDGVVLAKSTGSDQSSVNVYGKRIFTVPDEKVNSASPDDYKILLIGQSAASWCGNRALYRYKYIKKTCGMTVGSEMQYVGMGSQLDLAFEPFVLEPARLIEKSYNRDKKEIKIKLEFLNIPYEYFERDTDRPLPVELAPVELITKKHRIKWTKPLAENYSGFLLYFTTTPGEWRSEVSYMGASPVTIVNPETSDDGYFYYDIKGLNKSVVYHFKMKVIGLNELESEYSNTVKTEYTVIGDDNYFNLSGDPFESGLLVDNLNRKQGAGLPEWADYDAVEYDSEFYVPLAIYVSSVYRHNSAFSHISIESTDGVIFQFADSSVNGEWSTPVSGSVSVQLSGLKEFIFRAVFISPQWINNDKITIKEIR